MWGLFDVLICDGFHCEAWGSYDLRGYLKPSVPGPMDIDWGMRIAPRGQDVLPFDIAV